MPDDDPIDSLNWLMRQGLPIASGVAASAVGGAPGAMIGYTGMRQYLRGRQQGLPPMDAIRSLGTLPDNQRMQEDFSLAGIGEGMFSGIGNGAAGYLGSPKIPSVVSQEAVPSAAKYAQGTMRTLPSAARELPALPPMPQRMAGIPMPRGPYGSLPRPSGKPPFSLQSQNVPGIGLAGMRHPDPPPAWDVNNPAIINDFANMQKVEPPSSLALKRSERDALRVINQRRAAKGEPPYGSLSEIEPNVDFLTPKGGDVTGEEMGGLMKDYWAQPENKEWLKTSPDRNKTVEELATELFPYQKTQAPAWETDAEYQQKQSKKIAEADRLLESLQNRSEPIQAHEYGGDKPAANTQRVLLFNRMNGRLNKKRDE